MNIYKMILSSVFAACFCGSLVASTLPLTKLNNKRTFNDKSSAIQLLLIMEYLKNNESNAQ
jgi:hypothetical protein